MLAGKTPAGLEKSRRPADNRIGVKPAILTHVRRFCEDPSAPSTGPGEDEYGMDLVNGLTIGAGLYGAYKGHQAQERILEALDDQTGVLKEKLKIARNRSGDGDAQSSGDHRGKYVDVSA